MDLLLENDDLTEEQMSAPLLGVPFTCSESFGVKSLSFSAGLMGRRDVKAEEDADVIKLMRKSGAIPICVTNTSELGIWLESSNYVYGSSKNPYDTTKISGGSSGGEASLITSCGSVIGIGIDFSGSIRIPAALNGIYAHKPTNGNLKHFYLKLNKNITSFI